MYRLVATDIKSWTGSNSIPNITINLDASSTTNFGREELVAAGLSNKKVSRSQFEIKVDSDGTITIELKGTNSSLLNGDKLLKGRIYRAKVGDVIQVLPAYGSLVIQPVAVSEATIDADGTQEMSTLPLPAPPAAETAAEGSKSAPASKRKLSDDNSEEERREVKPKKDEVPPPELTPPASPRTELVRRESKEQLELFQRSFSNTAIAAEFTPEKAPLQKTNLDVIIEDVAKLRKVADNAGLFYDDSSAYACFVVRFTLDTSFLAKVQAKQWGLVPRKPVVVQLKFDWNYLDAPDPPALFIFQSEDPHLNNPTLVDYETEFGVVQWFLETRIQSILRKNWFNKPNAAAVVAARKADEKDKDNKPKPDIKLEKLKEDVKDNQSAAAASSSAVAAEKKKTDDFGIDLTAEEERLVPNESKAKQLTEMGFSREHVSRALRRCENKLEEAMQLLLGGAAPARKTNNDKIKKLRDIGLSENEAKIALDAFNGDVSAAVASLIDAGAGKKHSSVNKKGYKATKMTRYDSENEDSEGIEYEDEEAPPLKKTPKKTSKKAQEDPLKVNEGENLWLRGTEKCFLVNLYRYISERFITCPSHCLICDDELNVAVEKLPVCSDENCVKVYERTSVGKGYLINEIKNNPEVVDLLLNLLSCVASGKNVRGWNRGDLGLAGKNWAAKGAAAFGQRASFEPFPWGLGFEDKKKTQDPELLLDTLANIPAVSEMQKCASDEALKLLLDDIDPKAFPLLRWVIQSNRTHLSLVHPSKQIAEMKTPLQFQLVHSFPEHEKMFQDWKSKALRERKGNASGTYKAFHGSPITNWHSIIRTGLRSGFVRGIYMAGNASVSLGYMNVAQSESFGWRNSMWKHDKNISAIALLEVADMRHNARVITGGVAEQGVNVAMHNELVITRFLFFYPTGPKFPMSGRGPIAERIETDDFMWMGSSQDDEDDNKKKK